MIQDIFIKEDKINKLYLPRVKNLNRIIYAAASEYVPQFTSVLHMKNI